LTTARSDAPGTTAATSVSRCGHALVLLGSIAIVGLACVLRVRPDQRVEWSTGLVLPRTCATRALWNINCPACGLTRSFIYLASGEPYRSLRSNRVGWIVAMSVLMQIPLSTAALTGRARCLHSLLQWQSLYWLGLTMLLIANWSVRIIGW